MSNRKDFMQWLEEIDPDIQFDDTECQDLIITPSDDSPLMAVDEIVAINPEQFQFLAKYIREFRCGWTYKNTAIWREGDVWGADHQWIVNGLPQVFHLNLLDCPSDEELVDFIIMLNDGRLPVERPDDSPIIPFTFLTIGYRGDRFDVEAFVPCWYAPKPTWDEFSKELVNMAWQNEDGRVPLDVVQEAFDEESGIIKCWFDEYFGEDDSMTELEQLELGAGESTSDPEAKGESQ